MFIFCTFLCASAIVESAQERKELRPDSVRYVEIKLNDKEGKVIRLSNSQNQELTKRWNQARPIGLCKFYARYIIIAYNKNGEARTFRATENTIKEENDYCFVVGDSYIGSLWNANQ